VPSNKGSEQEAAQNPTYEIEQALLSTLVVNAFGGLYSCSVLLNLAPWRSTLLAAGVITGAALIWDIEFNPFQFLLAWTISVVLFVKELVGRRTFVTATSIVVQWGLFAHRSREYPLREVHRVTYQYPWLGESLHVGDIEVLGEGWALSLVGIKDPAEQAQRLLDRKSGT